MFPSLQLYTWEALFHYSVQLPTHAWDLHLKGPVYVSLSRPWVLHYSGDALHLGRSRVEEAEEKKNEERRKRRRRSRDLRSVSNMESEILVEKRKSKYEEKGEPVKSRQERKSGKKETEDPELTAPAGEEKKKKKKKKHTSVANIRKEKMLLEMEEALEQARKNMMLEMEEALKKARKEIKKEMKNKYRGLRAPTSPDLPVATSPDLPVATSDPFTSIFCGNLPANANADQIRNIFGLHAVEGIKMPPPLANGRARGWCYVTFFYAEEAESVMDLHKTEPFSLSDDSILGKDKTREFILCVAGENVNRTQRSNLHGDLVGREED